MKKVIVLVLSVTILTLCACQPTEYLESSSPIVGEFEVVEEQAELFEYKGKKNYQTVSCGYAGTVYQDDEFCYVYDEKGLYCISKESGKQEHVPTNALEFSEMCVFEDTLYFQTDGEIFIFDKQNQKFIEKSCLDLFSIEIDYLRPSYAVEVLMVKDGWLVYIYDENLDKSEVYLTDSDFTTKKQLPIPSFEFMLDDEIFCLVDDGNVICYNLSDEKMYLVTNYVIDEEDIMDGDEIAKRNKHFCYLGNGYISLYRNDKVNIINLLDCSVVTRLKYDADDIANILLDGDKLHVQIGNVIPYQGEETGFIDVISLLTGEIETIYSYKIELPYVYLGMECIDEQYIYLEKSGYDNEDGTPSGEYIRISKDGESEEIIFKQSER